MLSEVTEQNLRLARVGAEVQGRFELETAHSYAESGFARDGAVAFSVPEQFNAVILDYFADENRAEFSYSDALNGYSSTPLGEDVVKALNSQNIYYKKPAPHVVEAMEKYIYALYPEIVRELSYNFSVINVRAWQSNPGADYGPSAWHCDGGHQFFLPKLMLYVNGPTIEKGTIEFFTRDGRRLVLCCDRPTAILLDSSSLLHRGLASKQELRPVIEVTIAPSLHPDKAIIFAGQNARFPLVHVDNVEQALRSSASASTKDVVSASIPAIPLGIGIVSKPEDDGFNPDSFNTAQFLNIGGGPNFNFPSWLNFDAFPGEDVAPVSLSDDRPFPLPSSTIQLVYSSHCLEHLPDAAIERCLREARRVLRMGGDLVIKVPDYDAVLAAYRSGDDAFFAGRWNMEGIAKLWPSHGVTDTIEARASMVFCGFWNAAYGCEFGGSSVQELAPDRLLNWWTRFLTKIMKKPNRPSSAYHGPATLSQRKTKAILSQSSPKKIAKDLKDYVLRTETDCTFNHQTAFSRSEFLEIVESRGFELITSDSAEIKNMFHTIPKIEEMDDMSMYFHFRKI